MICDSSFPPYKSEYALLLSRHTLKLSQHDIALACNVFPENAVVRKADDSPMLSCEIKNTPIYTKGQRYKESEKKRRNTI